MNHLPACHHTNLQKSLSNNAQVASKVFLEFNDFAKQFNSFSHLGLDFEEANKSKQALQAYQKALENYNRALTIPLASMLVNEQQEAKVQLGKLNTWAKQIQERIQVLSPQREFIDLTLNDNTNPLSHNPSHQMQTRSQTKKSQQMQQQIQQQSFTHQQQQIQQQSFTQQIQQQSFTQQIQPSRQQHHQQTNQRMGTQTQSQTHQNKQKPLAEESSSSGFLSFFGWGKGSEDDLMDFSKSSTNNNSTQNSLSLSGGRSEAKKRRNSKELLQGIDKKAQEAILNEVVSYDTGTRWDDIAGMQDAKRIIHETVIMPMLRPDLFIGLRAPPRGILFFGPPGNGKTMIAKAIANEAKATFFSISASSVMSKWLGEGEKMVKALFAVARYVQPSVIFVDEIDSLLTSRSEHEHEASRRLKTEFLIQMDGLGSGNDRILLMGATNRPSEIDEAARRRFTKRIYVKLPDGPARAALLSSLFAKVPTRLKKTEFEKVVSKTEGYSGADLKTLATEAAMWPLREVAERLRDVDPSEVRPIVYSDLEKAINSVRPSVMSDSLKYYEEWNQQFGSF